MENLDKLFQKAADLPAGSCPLPEPGRGAPVIEEPELMDVLPMTGESPDDKNNSSERSRFEATVRELLEEGEITPEEAELLLISEQG